MSIKFKTCVVKFLRNVLKSHICSPPPSVSFVNHDIDIRINMSFCVYYFRSV